MYCLMMDQTLEGQSCPSETSSIISTPNGGGIIIHPPSGMQNTTTYQVLRVQDDEDIKKEGHQSADLYDHDDDINQELNLIDNLDMEESMHTSSQRPPDHEPRVFSCNYCQRKFYSSQALGGHQNAHKRERTIAKRGQRSMMAAATAFGHAYLQQPHHHLSSISNSAALPIIHHGGTTAYRSLGIQAHSMIQKPAAYYSQNTTTVVMSGHQNNNWSSRQTMLPAVGRKLISMETAAANYQASGSFHSGSRAAIDQYLPTDHIIGGGGCWWPPAGGGISLKPADQEDQLQKLDLSLKL